MDLLSMLKPYGKRTSVEDLGLYILPQVVAPRNATLVDQTKVPIVPFGGSIIAFEYKVPANRRGTLRRLGIDVVDPAALPDIKFSVQRSGSPVPNYQNVPIPIGTIGSPDEVNIVFDGDQLLQVLLINSNVMVNREVTVRVVAHFWDVIENWGR
jgi:hypothetical protein